MHVAEGQGLILDCKEYFAPIVTPYEAWLAFQGLQLDPASYRMDLSCLDAPTKVPECAAPPCSLSLLHCMHCTYVP